MTEDQAIIGFIILGTIILCLYFSPEILDFIDKKKQDRKEAKERLSPEELEKKERDGFKAIFRHKILGPLSIGFVVAVVGLLFENDSLIYMGTGIHIFGWLLFGYGATAVPPSKCTTLDFSPDENNKNTLNPL